MQASRTIFFIIMLASCALARPSHGSSEHSSSGLRSRRMLPHCSNHGTATADGCVCAEGFSGAACEQFTTTPCIYGSGREESSCGDAAYCLPSHVECLFTAACRNRKGWCVPLE